MSEQTIGLGNGADAETTTKTKQTRGTVTADTDLTAMAKISKIVNQLSGDDAVRVKAYFVEKWSGE